MSSEYDIIIKNTQILTMNKGMEIINNGYILVKDSKIVEIGSMADLLKKHNSQLDTVEEINTKDKLVIPGFINSHNHFAMTLFRGIADDLTLNDWLTNYIWPLEGMLEENDCYIGTKLAAIEMIQGGTTTACDMYFHESKVFEALEEIGFRGILGHGMLDFGNEEKRNTEIKETRNLINLVNKEAKLCSAIISPHAPNTCSTELLLEAKKLSEDYKLPLQIHLAETEKEVMEIKSKFNVTPTHYLHDIGFLCKELIAAHCIWMDKNDYKILKQNNVKIAHNPTSNLKLGSGILDFNQFKNHDILLTLGTDGPSSNNNLSMIEELRLACLIHKGVNRNPVILPAEEAVKMATINGAHAFGLQNEIGSLEKGKKADIVILNKKESNSYPPHNPFSMIAYAMNDFNVDTTIINGKIIMSERKFKTIDVSKTLLDTKEAIIQLLDRAKLEQFKDKIRFLK